MTIETMTPLMQQYHDLKIQYPEALMLFQVGDFYELFFDDAKNASSFLGIALTKRGTYKGEPIPLCGVPLHALDHYLHKLVKGGFCVAICDQLEQPAPGKIVKRGVTQVLTPGTLTDVKLLDEKSASYLCSFAEVEGQWGLLFAELLTAQVYATVVPAGSHKTLEAELHRFFPDEVLLTQQNYAGLTSYFKKQGYFTSSVATDDTMLEWARTRLSAQTQEKIQQSSALTQALNLVYSHVKRTNVAALETFHQIYFYEPDDFLIIDGASQKNLELLTNLQEGGRANTLLATLDQAVTPMGSRTLKKWLVRPLISQKMIDHRLDAVDYFSRNYRLMSSLQAVLKSLGDGERIVGRIALGRAQVHDYMHLHRILISIPQIKVLLAQSDAPAFLTMLSHSFSDFTMLVQLLESALHDDAASEGIIKKGFNEQLDYLRDLVNNVRQSLVALEQKEQAATGINSLKIRFNSVHGYYIEITQANMDLVPHDRYKRRQTLANRERYTCPELQQLENDITTAHSQITALEQELFEHVKQQVVPYVSDIRKMMHAVAQCDALLSFAVCAYERGYVRPVFHESRDIVVSEGKHPVVAQKLGSAFVANDTNLTEQESLWIITGPNMGGKSTYLRQVAQIVIMAQCGSFVPARSASLPIIDRIFTRIGASDNVAEGKSTFLVEMEETAHICQSATQNSLVILDEVGRGTSTFDGLALAQAIIEYLFTTVKARCLFATHYHELTKLQDQFAGIVSYYAASSSTPEGIVFLHKIIRGVADGSFGLEVAKLAHIPSSVIERARSIEQELSSQPMQTITPAYRTPESALQNHEQLRSLKLLSRVREIDYDTLSPKKAFDLLWELKEQLQDKNA